MRAHSLRSIAGIAPLLLSLGAGCAGTTQSNDEVSVPPISVTIGPAAGGGGTTDPCAVVPPPANQPLGPGDVDPYFGCLGTALYGQSPQEHEIHALAVQSDDKIIAVGRASTSTQDTWIARFDANGKLDPTFGTNGVRTINLTTPYSGSEFASAVVVQPDGHIVVGGGFDIPSPALKKGFLLRLDASGTLDPSFGTGGYVLINGMTWVRALALQSNNGLAVVGENVPADPVSSTASYGRFDGLTGAVDLALAPATNGIVVTNLGGVATARGFALAATSGDTVLFGGQTFRQSTALDVGLMKFNGSAVATTFGSGGQKAFGTSPNEVARGIVSIDTGYAIAEGSPDTNRFAVRRIDSVGASVSGYGIGGVASHGFASTGADARALVSGSGSKIVAVGMARTATMQSRMAVARFTSTGALDLTFSDDGATTLAAKGDHSGANAVVRQSTGKIVIGGWSNLAGQQRRAALVRLLY